MSPQELTALSQGWLTGASLIAAIGAQNALVLRQGLAQRHVAPVVALCTLSDIALICLGVFGLGQLISASALSMQLFRWGGAAFLLIYGLYAARRAWAGGAGLMAAPGRAGLAAVLGSTLAMTWLNPHVYLDTVVLLGTLGAQHPGAARWAFLRPAPASLRPCGLRCWGWVRRPWRRACSGPWCGAASMPVWLC